MTGTHGGALTVPSLHTFVSSYTLVKPDGDMMTVTKQDDPLLFSAMAPSMGVFGAVVEMEIDVVPLEILEARMEVISFEDLADAFEPAMRSNKYARVVVYPSINKATIWTANPVPSRKHAIAEGATNAPNYANFRNEKEKKLLEEYLILCKEDKFDEADMVLHTVLDSQLNRLKHYVGQYNHVLCKERCNGIPHADIEFNFDFGKNREVIRNVQKYCNGHRVPYYNFEIRATKQDDAMLSCCHGRDAMWIDFQAKADISRAFFDEIEAVLKPIGFRKHWAKGMDNTSPGYVVQQFPLIGTFLQLMKDFDPDGKFRNTQGESWFKMLDRIDFEVSAQPQTLGSTTKATTNWAETVSVDPAQFRYPESISEVVSLVKTHDKIRCAGALHSCAPLITSEGIIMSLTKLDQIINIDLEKKSVRCLAGVRIHDLW